MCHSKLRPRLSIEQNSVPGGTWREPARSALGRSLEIAALTTAAQPAASAPPDPRPDEPDDFLDLHAIVLEVRGAR